MCMCKCICVYVCIHIYIYICIFPWNIAYQAKDSMESCSLSSPTQAQQVGAQLKPNRTKLYVNTVICAC